MIFRKEIITDPVSMLLQMLTGVSEILCGLLTVVTFGLVYYDFGIVKLLFVLMRRRIRKGKSA